MSSCTPGCPICTQIELCQSGQHPRLLAETQTGWAVMGQSQMFRGYSVLLCKIPARELHHLDFETRLKYLQEMALLAEAVFNVVAPRKLNYECLGNLAGHLHWHILPRHHDDLQPGAPAWGFWDQQDAAHFYAPERDGTLRDAIAVELKKLMQQAKGSPD